MENTLLSIVVPVYNEMSVLQEFHRRLTQALHMPGFSYEVLYVNDGSADNTPAILDQLRADDPQVGIIDLSRNFGKEIAMTAGLEQAIGDAVVVIDADLQDPPELIPELIREWRNGYDVVYAQRLQREGESWFKKKSAELFYRLLWRLSNVEIPKNTGDFRLLSRRAVDALLKIQERHRYMKGLFAWIGYPQKAILYNRDPRASGHSKWNYWRLWNFALEGITSFSDLPLKISTYIGALAALGSLAYGTFMLIKTLILGNPIPGYPSLIVIILFLGGIQLISLGIIGEYLARTYTEAKHRPLYFTKNFHPSQAYLKQVQQNPST